MARFVEIKVSALILLVSSWACIVGKLIQALLYLFIEVTHLLGTIHLLPIYAGAGIHVIKGGLPGSLPNNGIAIALLGDVFRLRLYCRSDSTLPNVGQLIGPNGTTVTTGDVFDINRHNPGELTVENQPPRNALTTNDQGVYTCRIPLQSGEKRNINIGIYTSGFSSELYHERPIISL